MSSKQTPTPATEVVPKASRRVFTSAFKRQVVEELLACKNEHGKVGELLRRHGLYSTQVSEWKQAYNAGLLGRLNPPPRGPEPRIEDPRDARIRELEAQLTRMTVRAERAEVLIDVQKKLVALLSPASTTNEDAE